MTRSKKAAKPSKFKKLFQKFREALFRIYNPLYTCFLFVVNFIAQFLKKESGIPKFKARLVWVFINAFFLVVLTIALQYTQVVRPDETSFLRWATILKHKVFNIDKKPDFNNVIFIDVAKDLALTDDGEYGAPDSTLSGAKQAITDRAKLARLFSILNAHPNQYKYVICDILFEKPGPGDSLLKPQIEKLKHIITSAIWDNDKLVRPIYNVPYGVVNYTAIDKVLLTKIPVYFKDSIKSLPVTLYEQTTRHRFTTRHGLVWLDGKLTFNTIIPEFYYRPFDLVKASDTKKVNTYSLGELLFDPDCFSLLKDKIIIIGDFSNDQHLTNLEYMPGALILWDTFLTLRYHPETVSVNWLLMLFVFYFVVSYWIIVHPDRKIEELHEKIKVPFIKEFILKYISFIGLLIIINIFSYFYFGAFISLFYIATYLTFIQVLIDEFPKLSVRFSRFFQHKE